MEIDSTTGDVGETQDSQESTAPEMVPIEEASSDDLSAFLQKANEEDKLGEDSTDGTETEESVAEESREPTEQETAIETADEAQTDSPKAEEPSLSKEELEAKLERQTRTLEETELYAKHRSTEIGELRKKNNQLKEQLEDSLDEKFITDPKQAHKDQKKIDQLEEEEKALDAEEQQVVQYYQAQRVIAKHINPDEFDMNQVCSCLESDGLDPRFVQAFRANPYTAMRPETIVQLHYRALEKKTKDEALYYLKALHDENVKLKEAVKTKPQNMLSKIEKTLNEIPTLTSGKSQSNSIKDYKIKDPSEMSSEELDRFLAESQAS